MKKHASFLSLLLTGAMLAGSFPVASMASQPSDFGLETAYNIAAEGTVLLKNDEGALPLEKGMKLNVFGLTQVQTFLGGSGSGSGSIENPVFLTDALRAEGFEVNEDLYNAYEAYWNADEHWIEEQGWFGPVRKSTLRRCIDVVDGVGLGQAFSEYVIGYEEMPVSEELLAQAKDFSDTAVLIISRSGSEGADLAESDMRLYDDEAALLEQVTSNFSKVVVLLNTATNLEMGFLEDYPSIKAAALIWAPGIRGCEAVADILSGDVNPSGKLADSAAYSIKDYPSNENFGVFYEDDAFTRYLEYEEDIYVGYRYFATFDKPVQFPFGYGLSYTTFDLDAEGVAEDEEHVSLTVTVTNTGDVAGKEVVQAYVSAPDGTLEKPAMELSAFAKTQLLDPGAAQTLTLTWNKRDMASYSEESAAYLLEAGEYKILVGNSSQNLAEAGVIAVVETITYDTDATTGTPYQNLFTSERSKSLVKLSKLDESTYPTMPESGVLTAEETEEAEEVVAEEEAAQETEEVAEETEEAATEEAAEGVEEEAVEEAEEETV
ncbi:MAG: glycoside hydrolase family 3 C-terminal domain-containing protein, partial [Blautia sp.]|nr:glycoside hydrolase family 3 C-terminal domain-containing protein [Blautia sp.]